MIKGKPATPTIRCAIYTRKSSDEGLQQDFNSLDAQRESAEAYIASQVGVGWICLAGRYDDGGYSGGSIERPALKRLISDIEAGKIDCVVVYKVDRLSRSLLDFARLMQTFEKCGVSFVAVTQQFNTTTSMGRLMLNVLLSFAQFERELASERTRDKIAAARKKGKWAGGHPLLGYDIVHAVGGSRLTVNDAEAEMVRQIFDKYLEHRALMPVVADVAKRGWRTKHWATKAGRSMGGRPFDKSSLYNLLTNVAYVGKVKHHAAVYDGEHAAIVDSSTFDCVQDLMQRNGRSGGAAVRNKHGALLKGLLRCVPCGCAMFHHYSSKKGHSARYRYYVCVQASKRGWHTCASKSVPAEAIEGFVVDRLRSIGSDPVVLAETIKHVRAQGVTAMADLKNEHAALQSELRRHDAEIRRLARDAGDALQLAELHDRVRHAEQRATAVQQLLRDIGSQLVDEREIERSLRMFEPVWDRLTPRERTRIVQLLVHRVDYDGARQNVRIVFNATGVQTLAANLDKIAQEAAA